MAPIAPCVTEPISGRSRLVARPSVGYTEVDGQPVLADASDRAVHRLSPATAALWACLDGRTLDRVVDQAPGSDETGTARASQVLEVLRRLKALGLVVDQVDDHTSSASAPRATGATTAPVHLAGHLSDVDDGLRLDLGRWDHEPAVAVDPVGATAGQPPTPLTALGMPVADPGRAGEPLSPFDTLDLLVAAADPEDLLPGLDGLAHLAEHLPATRVPSPPVGRISGRNLA